MSHLTNIILIHSMLLLVFNQILAQFKYINRSVYKVYPLVPEHFKLLQELQKNSNFSFWKEASSIQPAEIMVGPKNKKHFIEFLLEKNVTYDLIINDVQKLFDAEKYTNQRRKRNTEFDLSSYHSIAEINDWLTKLPKKYPGIVQIVEGGKTFRGSKILGVKISLTRKPKGQKRGIFIEGGIHAREWISPAVVLHLINYLLDTKKSQNSDSIYLATNYDWYLFPVFNPDGYEYSRKSDRLWRKTRSYSKLRYPLRKPKCIGVDPNRNWGYKWEAPPKDVDKCGETYPGEKAFSEIETHSLSKYITSIAPELLFYVAFHSYGHELLMPFGHNGEKHGNHEQQLAVGKAGVEVFAENNYAYTTGTMAYLQGRRVLGTSMDWVKGTFNVPFCFTYELPPDHGNGFYYPQERIHTLSEIVIASLKAMVQKASTLQS